MMTGVIRSLRKRRYEHNVSTIGQRTHETGHAQPASAGVSSTPGARTVSECLERDHRRLDASLNQAAALAREGDFATAQRTFASFRTGLDKHIDAEEEILFPVYEQRCAGDGPTNVMLGEHANIRRLMAAVAEHLGKSDGHEAGQQLLALARALSAHNFKEERVIYPETDAALELDVDRVALVARIEEHLGR
ncbi:MAG TPA: hemerythrin domain-containing protein [Polyangiaceae bacterium]|jgi:iron-sulfur cluster repair protein YtfE (RIC family)|nr:hemerythrin domain-containing protein [Polyangiaceae bacterium]